jgi:hypothetical protein
MSKHPTTSRGQGPEPSLLVDRPWATFQNTFTHHTAASSTVSDDLCTREVGCISQPSHTKTGNISDKNEKWPGLLVAGSKAKTAKTELFATMPTLRQLTATFVQLTFRFLKSQIIYVMWLKQSVAHKPRSSWEADNSLTSKETSSTLIELRG